MYRQWSPIALSALLTIACLLLITSSCARDQQLVGITIQPASVTFGSNDPSQVANLTALGSYIHPPETKDITTVVTWKSDGTQLVTVTSSGTVSPTGLGCGTVNISASDDHGTPNGSLIIGYANVTVDGPNGSGCPTAASSVLSVFPQSQTSTGDSITSAPAGINCPAQSCGASFTSGTAVTLTAAPLANFVSWGPSCSSVNSNICIVTLTANIFVTANFQ